MWAAAAKSHQSCPTLCDPIDGSPLSLDSPGKNTGVGCHFLLQCMKVKSEREIALSDPMDCSLPGSSIPGILQARTVEWVAISFSSAWKWKVKVKSLSHVWLLATPWTAAYQAPLSMGFYRKEYWSGVPLWKGLRPYKWTQMRIIYKQNWLLSLLNERSKESYIINIIVWCLLYASWVLLDMLES